MAATHPTPAKREQRRERTQAAQRSAAAGVSKLSEPFTRLVDGMTNWQRSRWAQAGYPGLQAHEAAAVAPFARMRRPSA